MINETGLYLNNPNLRKSGVEHKFSAHEVSEWIKCRDDILHFSTYLKITHPDGGIIPFKPYEYQQRLLPKMVTDRFTIVKNPRQSGKTTNSLVFILHYILFNKDKLVGLLANKADVARELMGRLQASYERLPRFLQQGIIEWNKSTLTIENGSRAMAFATSSSAARSYSFSCLYIDEMAFIDNNIWEPFWKSVYPTISAGTETKVILVSTPKGMNHFYKMWEDAVKGKNAFKPFSINWNDIPGRDDEWRAETIKNVGVDMWRQEFETEFLGSSNTLIRGDVLSNIVYNDPIYSNQNLSIYEEPIEGHSYVIPIDTSHGVGSDYCAFTIIDITKAPYKIVGKFRDNELSPLVFPDVIHQVANRYNKSTLLPEINDIGGQVAITLHQDLEYEDIIFCAMKGRRGQVVSGGHGGSSYAGVRMSVLVKKIGCSTLKNLIEEQKLIINDFDIFSELTTFVSRRKSFEAEEGHHDDLVMTLVMFAWLTTQDYFKELKNINVKTEMYKNRLDTIESDLLPALMTSSDEPDDDPNYDMGGDNWDLYDGRSLNDWLGGKFDPDAIIKEKESRFNYDL